MICCPWSSGGLMVRQQIRKEKGKRVAKYVPIEKGECIIFRGNIKKIKELAFAQSN